MSYPEFAHIGFKIIATCWFYGSFRYMQATAMQRDKKIKLLEQQNEYLKQIQK